MNNYSLPTDDPECVFLAHIRHWLNVGPASEPFAQYWSNAGHKSNKQLNLCLSYTR